MVRFCYNVSKTKEEIGRSKELVPSHLLAPAGTGSLEEYMQEVNRIPILTLEQEQSLARRYRDEEDLEAARRLVMAHLRFVVHVARGYSGYGLQVADLIQEGNIGDRKSTRLNSSHVAISYAVFCLKKK